MSTLPLLIVLVHEVMAAPGDGHRAQVAERPVEAWLEPGPNARVACGAMLEGENVDAKGRALYDALRAHVDRGAFVLRKDDRPEIEPPHDPDWVLARIDAGGEPTEVGCLELSLLMTVLARACGLDARLALVPPSDSSQLADHVVVGLARAGQGFAFFDPFRARVGVQGEAWPLTERAVVARLLNQLAVADWGEGERGRALARITRAVKMAPDVASFAANRAVMLSARGEHHLALAEAVAAVELEPNRGLHWHRLALVASAASDTGLANLAGGKAEQLAPGLRVQLVP